MFADVRKLKDEGLAGTNELSQPASMLWMTEEEQQRRAMDFCASHYRTDMESQHCVEKILSGDVVYEDSLHYVVASAPVGR